MCDTLMSARVSGVHTGWLLNQEPVGGFAFRVSYPSEVVEGRGVPTLGRRRS